MKPYRKSDEWPLEIPLEAPPLQHAIYFSIFTDAACIASAADARHALGLRHFGFIRGKLNNITSSLI